MEPAALEPTEAPVTPKQRNRLPRRLAVAVLAICGLAVASFVGLRIYLSTPAAARMVSNKLAKTLGVPIRVDSISAGFGSSAVNGVSIDGADGKPWASAKSITADVTVAGLARGESPSGLAIHEADITLHFDRAGKLSTSLPKGGAADGGTMPEVRIENSRLAILQEGHPDSVFTGVDALLREDAGLFLLTGTVDDERWGKWTIALDVDAKTRAGKAVLKTTSEVKVTPDTLQRIPFVPTNVWDEVILSGDTTATVNLDFRPADDHFHYLVTAEPRNTDVHVTDIELRATQASGNVKVEGGVVSLKDVRGKMAKGDLQVSGVLDFHKIPSVLNLAVEAKSLMVKDLPAHWGVAGKIPVKGIGEGRLEGHADLVVKTGPDGTTTGGSGVATVVLPSFVSGQDLRINIQLAPRGRRFEFGPKLGLPSSLIEKLFLKSDKEPGSDAATLALLTTLLQTPPEPKKDELPSYLDLNFALRDVDLAELLTRLEVTTPFKIGGRITFQVKAAIPTDRAGDLKSYRFTGTAELPKLTIEDLTLIDVKAELKYRDGKLTLADFSARVPDPNSANPGGSFRGTASLGLLPAGDLTANLQLTKLPVGQVLGLFPELAKGAEGAFTGRLDLTAPAGNLRDPAQWTGTAQLNADSAKAIGLTVRQVAADLKLADGVLELTQLTGDIEGSALTATGDLRLVNKYPFQGRVELAKADLAALDKLYPAFKPPVALAGKLQAAADLKGTLRPAVLTSTGTGSVTDLRVDGFPVDKLDFKWDVDKDRVRLTDIASRLFGGAVDGTADIPLRSDVAGSVDLKLKEVDLADLSRTAPSTAGLKFEGKAVGFLKAALPAVKPGEPRQATLEADIKADKLKVRDIPAEKLHATAAYRDGSLKYKLEANALGGTIELDGRYPPSKATDEPQGRLEIRGVKLAKLLPALGIRDALSGLDGDAYLDLPYRHQADGQPIGTGELHLDRLRYKDRELTPRIKSRARITGSQIRLEQIDAPFGSGTVRGLVIFDFRNFERSRAILSLRNVPSANLLFPFPEFAKRIDAPLDAEIRTSLGREIRGSGVVSAAAGKFLGQRAGMVRVPLEWDVVPSQQRGIISMREVGGELAQGRLSGHATYEYFGAYGGQAEGDIRFRNISVPSLVRTESDLGRLGIGNATGSFEFSGENVRSVDDLKGTLKSTLGETQLSEIPVLKEVLPFLGPSSRVADRRSEVRATLSKGLWRVDKLALVGRQLQLFGDGTISTDGRLNLDMTANTGRLDVSPLALRAFGIAVPVMVGPIPVSLILEITRYLSNRTIHLEVTGTLANPSVRVKPLLLLRDEAIRFFLDRNNIPSP